MRLASKLRPFDIRCNIEFIMFIFLIEIHLPQPLPGSNDARNGYKNYLSNSVVLERPQSHTEGINANQMKALWSVSAGEAYPC